GPRSFRERREDRESRFEEQPQDQGHGPSGACRRLAVLAANTCGVWGGGNPSTRDGHRTTSHPGGGTRKVGSAEDRQSGSRGPNDPVSRGTELSAPLR